MAEKRYVIKGEAAFRKGRFPFVKVVEGKSLNHALHKLLSLFGSLNGLKRSAVKVKEVEEHAG